MWGPAIAAVALVGSLWAAAALTSPRFSVLSGGITCVAAAGVVVLAFPALARYDKDEAIAAMN